MKKNKSFFYGCFFIICSVFTVNNLSAQNQFTFISLNDALALAEKNYPLLKAKDWNVKAAESHLASTKDEAYIPALKLHEQVDYATSNAVQGTYFSYGIVIPTSGGIGTSNNSNPVYGSISLASFEWVPFSFGQNKSRVEVSRKQLQSTQLDTDNEKFQQQVRVAEAYLGLAALHQLASVAQINLQNAATIKTTTTALAKSGLRPGVDSSLANSELSKAVIDLYEAQKNETKARIFLADLMGQENTNFTIDTVTFFTKEPTIQRDTNFSSLPFLKFLQSKVDLSNAEKNLISCSYYPRISLLSGVWGRGSGMGIPAGKVSDASFAGGTNLSRYDYAIGIACTFNILDYPHVHNQFLSQQSLTSSFTEEYNQFALDTKANMAVADTQIEYARKQKQETPVQYEAATNAFNQSKARYEAGLATITEVSQALYVLNRAAADKVIANNNLWRAYLQKSASTGNLSDFLNQIK